MLLCQSFCTIALKDKLYGEWEYQYSIIDTVPMRMETTKHNIVQKMVFTNCNDKDKMKQLPIIVQNLRKNNLLENCCCKTFNNEELIDEYFPVVKPIEKTSGKTLYAVFNYGYHYKSEYYIETIRNDTLIIFDEKNYTINNKEYVFVKHLYLKTRSSNQ